MSLNNIQLKDLVVSELYRDNLMASEGPGTAIAPAPEPQPAAQSSPLTAQSPKPEAHSSPLAAHSSPLEAQSSPLEARSPYKFLGSNRRNITIVVHSPGIAFLPDDQLNVLTRMLEACRMNMGDVAIVNHAAAPVIIAPLKQQLQPAFILLFGPKPPDIGLPMDFPVFKIQKYDQCTYLTAPSLEELVAPGDESRLLKSKLWVCLKTMFEI
ncbi:hypothetical protein Q4E93_16225 [Flavitalea sp. BT771]|uniref:hypothetical protein n=1 Tax=Flavitalea sp. BT771 TaxID=3063329 RepID=UPI0026E28A36|nr:hypothetical protein [Flavitalea sp. BT771]MDO6432150.1 hypothetical protein [Flavitalea sp. BT771]MDV6221059.1 hypothetical protein [Flavitalea sp. BT771]